MELNIILIFFFETPRIILYFSNNVYSEIDVIKTKLYTDYIFHLPDHMIPEKNQLIKICEVKKIFKYWNIWCS